MTDQVKDSELVGTEAPPPAENQPVAAQVKDNMVWVTLIDGRVIGTPLDWYPLLQDGTPEQWAKVDLIYDGVCWPDLDECLSVEHMLQGRRPIPWTREELKRVITEAEAKHPIKRKKR